MAKKKKIIYEQQVAALPIVTGIDGKPQVVLVTSRETGRWVIPKGWTMRGRKDHEAAAVEAFEEAGVTGKVEKRPLGTYEYVKVMPKGQDDIDVRVTVYLLDVDHVLGKWPELKERTRDMVSTIEAAERVDEDGLRQIIRDLNKDIKLTA